MFIRLTKLQSVKKWHVFETQQNTINSKITVSKVVWQHVLGSVDNVIHCFVENLTGFPVVKDF